MNQMAKYAQSPRKKTSPHQRKLTTNAILVIALVLALAVTIFLFARSYRQLREAIQQERIDYVGEISNQLITGHRFMHQEYSDSVQRFAGIVNRSSAACFDDVAACFLPDDANQIMLISEAGGIRGLNEKNYFTSDRSITETLTSGDGVTQLFASLNNELDFWLFATAIEPLQLEDQRYITVMLAVPAKEFSQTLAISLFGSRGASYIINKGGSIEIKPDDVSVALGGYNLFSSLRQSGVSDSQTAELQAAIGAGDSGSMLLEMQGQEWLFGYNSIDEDSAIVVAVPLTLTAAKTYAGLSNTILFMAAAILVIALIAFLVMLRFFYRDKERSRLAMAAEAKSSFFSKMSHDIRTPLNAIIGLQTLIADSSDMEQIRVYNEQSAAASTYLLSILNDVLDMSRIESGELYLAHEPFDMDALLTEISTIAAGMANDKKIAFTQERDGEFATYYVGDALRVKQVLMNLLHNALKFTRPGGQVDMRVSHAAGNDGRDTITLTVRDTGIGMSEEYLSKIFTPFVQEHSSFTQEYPGSGLGLAIVYNLVSQMGGTIDVKSELDKGSLFAVTLLLERGAAVASVRPADAPRREQALSFAGKRVLLAEDNQINQMIAAKLLHTKYGIDVEAASDGQQAVDMFRQSEPGYFSLILMDIKMPNLDGLHAASVIRALPRPDAASVPILALSANAYAEDVALSLEAGMNGHLSKPIDARALADALKQYLLDEKEDI